MTTATHTEDAIPDFLKVENRTAKASNGVTIAAPTKTVEVLDKATGIKAKVEKPAKARAPKAAKAPKPGKVVKASHKPANVVATEDNPQKSIVPVRFKAKYAEHNDSNGDRVALALKAATTTKNKDGRDAVDLDALAKIAADNGIDMAAYSKLNVGMKRMNVGNRLRGMLKNEKPVTIGKQRFADWEKAKVVAPPKAA